MNIPSIIIVNIMHFLSVKDIINLSLTSKTTIDDSTWKIYAYLKWWNKQFWDKALKEVLKYRNHIIYGNMKLFEY